MPNAGTTLNVGVEAGSFAQHLHHTPVIFQSMQARPWQNILSGFRIAILRLMLCHKTTKLTRFIERALSNVNRRSCYTPAFLTCASWTRYIGPRSFPSCVPWTRCFHVCFLRTPACPADVVVCPAQRLRQPNPETFSVHFPRRIYIYDSDAVLIGVLLGLGRMSADSEIIALTALGIGRRRILLPVGVLAFTGAVATMLMTLWLGPVSLGTFRKLETDLIASQVSFQVQPRVFDERFPRLVLYINDVSASARNGTACFSRKPVERTARG